MSIGLQKRAAVKDPTSSRPVSSASPLHLPANRDTLPSGATLRTQLFRLSVT